MIQFKYLRDSKISKRFLKYFLAIALLPSFIAIWSIYYYAEIMLKEEIIKDLSMIADHKVKQVENYALEIKKYVSILAHTPNIIKAMEEFGEIPQNRDYLPEYLSKVKDYKPFFKYFLEIHDSHNILFISSNGLIIFSMLREEVLGTNLFSKSHKESELAKVFQKASTLFKTEISEFQYYPPSGKPAAFIASPVFSNNKFLGVIVLQVNPESIYKLAQNYMGLKTGEIVLAYKKGNKVEFIAPLRNDPFAAFNRKVFIDSHKGTPIQLAVQGKQGAGFSIDYQGKEVLAVWRYIPLFRWGMVVKIERSEALSLITNIKIWSLMIAIVTLLLVFFVTLWLATTISEPIVRLTQSTAKIVDGDLNDVVVIQSNDELSQLSKSFNRMLEKFRDMIQELKRSNKELEQFAYVASHDLQAPLRSVVNYAQFLEQDYKERIDETADKYIKRIVDASIRMQTLIKDLLAFSRIGTHGKQFELVNCEDILSSVIDDFSQTIEETEATIIYGTLPKVIGDDIQLHQLFQNLIGNALKYRSEKKPHIHIVAEDKNVNWLFSIRDNGIGIEQQYFEQIFIIFQRLHTRDEYSGTGIGLANCKKIVERHKGRIWVESKMGEGSTFYFNIPKTKEGTNET